MTRRSRLERLFQTQHLLGRADERQPSRQRLIEHDADAVPIGLGTHRPRGRLLGRHVRDRSHEVIVGPQPVAGSVGDHPEIEHHDPPARGDEDVRGLDIAMNFVGAMDRLQAARELHQPGAETSLVGAPGSLR